MKLSRRTFLRLSSSATLGALAAACAPQTVVQIATPESQAAATATPKPTEAPKAAEPTPTPVPEQVWPRGDVPRERTLIMVFSGAGGEFGNVGIAGPYAQGFTHQAGDAYQMEGLYFYSAHADVTYPWLAESHQYNDDATQLTVNIRKGATWSDGEPFTAQDVVFTVNMLIEHAPVLRDSAAIAKWVKSIEAVDDHTVLVTFTEPNWRFMFTYFTFRFDRGTYLVPEHIYKDVEAPVEFGFWDPENGWPVVTGPYQLVEFTSTHKHFDLRYEWWAIETGLMDEMPKPERIIQLPAADDTTSMEMIINNDVDCMRGLPPQKVISILDHAKDHIITHSGHDPPYGYVDWWPVSMYFNTLEAPYDNPDVRWAVAYAIDQQQAVDVGWQGGGQVTDGPFPYYPPLLEYINSIKDITDEYDVLEVNLDKVEERMTAAGFSKDSEGFWVDADGVRPDADIYAAVPIFADTTPILAEQMRKAGFDARHVTPPDVWAAKDDGRALLHLNGHGGSVIDPYYTMEFYHSRNQKPTGESCGNNRPRWANPEYDEVVDEMSVTPMGDPKMKELFRRGMEIWYKELPEVPIVQWFHRIPYNTTYWTNWPTEENLTVNGALWHLTAPIVLWHLKPA